MNDYQKRILLFQSFKQLTEMIVIGGGGGKLAAVV